MFKILSCVVRSILHPKKYFKEHIKLPIIRFVSETADLYKRRTQNGITSVKEVIFRGTVISLITALLVWLSILMYMAFYYVYVPVISHERPVYLQFKACQDVRGICSFPAANIQLTHRQQLLMQGQSYKIRLDLDMPESSVNKELGMFMVCAEFQGSDGSLVASSCRSTMLHYRSFMLDFIYKIVFIPFYVFGKSEEKQELHVELFSDYEEHDQTKAVTDVYIEIRSRYIEIYSAKFLINAQFSGLRYVMFYWPVLSAAIGITSNLFFIALVCMITWYQIVQSEEYRQYIIYKEKLEQMEGDLDDDSSSSFEHASGALEESKSGSGTLVRRHIVDEREFVEEIDQ